MSNKIFCLQPFEYCEINWVGDVYVCCDFWCNYYSIGNILENSFEEIWNGEKRKKLINQFEKQDFVYCNTKICPLCKTLSEEDFQRNFEKKVSDISSIKKLRINYDHSCNLRCIICRYQYKPPSEEEKEVYKKLEAEIVKLLPFLNQNKVIINLCGIGEVFYSKMHMRLIKKIAEEYKNIKFAFISNGILCTESNIKKLGVENLIDAMEISCHAFTKETYDKICPNGNFYAVKQNIEYFARLKKEQKINSFHVNFTVNALNYKEMEDFAGWILSLGAIPEFLPFLRFEERNDKIYDDINVIAASHPLHKDFVKTLKNPFFKNPDILIPSQFLSL